MDLKEAEKERRIGYRSKNGRLPGQETVMVSKLEAEPPPLAGGTCHQS